MENCPYCNGEIEIDHEEGQGYTEDETHQQECDSCDKTFIFSTFTIYHYRLEKAECLNGGNHTWKKSIGIPKTFPMDYYRCQTCGEEKQTPKT